MSNIPITTSTDSAESTKKYFNNYFNAEISFNSNQVDAVVSFFQKRGFDTEAAISVACIILKQAKVDNVKVFELLDTLKGYNELQLSSIVTQILNASRARTSELGYKIPDVKEATEQRNIVV